MQSQAPNAVVESRGLDAVRVCYTAALLVSGSAAAASAQLERAAAVAGASEDWNQGIASDVDLRLLRCWVTRALREPVADPHGGAASESALDAAGCRDIYGALQALPLETRTMVALHFAGPLSYGQLAEVMGLPVEYVRDRLRTGRRTMRRDLVGCARVMS